MSARRRRHYAVDMRGPRCAELAPTCEMGCRYQLPEQARGTRCALVFAAQGPATLLEIAEAFDVVPEAVRQLEAIALERFRRAARVAALERFERPDEQTLPPSPPKGVRGLMRRLRVIAAEREAACELVDGPRVRCG